jgi:hypothetical protein
LPYAELVADFISYRQMSVQYRKTLSTHPTSTKGEQERKGKERKGKERKGRKKFYLFNWPFSDVPSIEIICGD